MRLLLVMPSLNQGSYIGSALESVARQNYTCEVEIIVVDACSTDETHDEVERVRRAFPELVRVVVEPDDGQSDAINKGVAMADSDIVGWLNADDRLMDGTIERWHQYWISSTTTAAVAVYGDVVITDARGERVSELREQHFDLMDLLWGPCYVPQPSTTIARWAWDEVGGLDTTLDYAMDLDLWLRLSALGEIVHLPEALSEFRRHSTSKTVSGHHAMYQEARLVRQRHAEQIVGRRPTLAEMEVRHHATRLKRRLRRLRGRGQFRV